MTGPLTQRPAAPPPPPQRPGRVEPLTRLASALLLAYLRHCPVERGKWRLTGRVRPFLLIELEPGVFITPLGQTAPVDRALIRHGLYEPETVQVFRELLGPGMTVLDLGANIGQYTLIAAHRVGPTGRVHAFEPTPRVADHLRRNITRNGFLNVTVNELAVSDAPGEVELHCFEPDNPGENSIVGDALRPQSPGHATLKVRTVTLDDYVREHVPGPVDLIKMDIEGAEPLALRGASSLLSGDRAPVILLEVNPRALGTGRHGAGGLLEILGSHGYEFRPVSVYGRHTHNPWVNGVASKPTHRGRFPFLRDWPARPVSADELSANLVGIAGAAVRGSE